MRVNVALLTLLSLVILLFALPVAAQSTRSVNFSMPFAFTAGNNDLSPGEYTVSINDNPGLLTISGPHGTMFVVVRFVRSSGNVGGLNGVMFAQGSEGYTLHKVCIEARCFDLMHGEMENDL